MKRLSKLARLEKEYQREMKARIKPWHFLRESDKRVDRLWRQIMNEQRKLEGGYGY